MCTTETAEDVCHHGPKLRARTHWLHHTDTRNNAVQWETVAWWWVFILCSVFGLFQPSIGWACKKMCLSPHTMKIYNGWPKERIQPDQQVVIFAWKTWDKWMGLDPPVIFLMCQSHTFTWNVCVIYHERAPHPKCKYPVSKQEISWCQKKSGTPKMSFEWHKIRCQPYNVVESSFQLFLCDSKPIVRQ